MLSWKSVIVEAVDMVSWWNLQSTTGKRKVAGAGARAPEPPDADLLHQVNSFPYLNLDPHQRVDMCSCPNITGKRCDRVCDLYLDKTLLCSGE